MLIVTFLVAMLPLLHANTIQTTWSVSMLLDGFVLPTWTERSLWNETRLSIVQYLNKFCKDDFHCDADYGIDNVHLIQAVQCQPAAICLNITADRPVLPLPVDSTSPKVLSSYNYTALLAGALSQTKIDIERAYGQPASNSSLFTASHSDQNFIVSRTNRFLLVLLGILLVAIVFGLTVFFFQSIRRHNYSKLLKTTRAYQQHTPDQPLTNSPSMSAAHP